MQNAYNDCHLYLLRLILPAYCDQGTFSKSHLLFTYISPYSEASLTQNLGHGFYIR